MDRNKIGKDAETQALQYLLTQGLSLIKTNYRCRRGEIDIIMQDGPTVVFVEVRLRRHQHYGGALASITHSKQQKIIYTAQDFLTRHPRFQQASCRFDVVTLDSTEALSAPVWYKDAFRL